MKKELLHFIDSFVLGVAKIQHLMECKQRKAKRKTNISHFEACLKIFESDSYKTSESKRENKRTTMSQGLKGIHSGTETHSVPDSLLHRHTALQCSS